MAVFNKDNRLVPFILGMEGGWVDDPDDKGGETNKGITYGTFTFLCRKALGVEPIHDHFMKLTHEEVAKFVECYWNDVSASKFDSQAVAEYITDWNWGSGVNAAKRLQRVLCNLGKAVRIDGQIGPATLSAANSIPGADLLSALFAERVAFYNSIAPKGSKNNKFLKGWTRRATEQYNALKNVA